MDLERLKSRFKGIVISDEETRKDVSSDFGRLVQRVPLAVAVPASSDDVRSLIEMANEEGWQISIRGSAHSQSGQSLSAGGILLDMLGLAKTSRVHDGRVWVDAGVIWSDLLAEVLPHGFIPPVLTANLNVTVGGSLSVGGIGSSSHQYGTQADNVEALEVVTGTGDLVRCSADENGDLFHCVLSGLGQFAVITRVKLKLRRMLPNVRTFYLLYDQAEALMHDQTRLLSQGTFDFIECWSVPCFQGFRRLGETRVPFAEWFYPAQLSVEYGEVPPHPSCLSGLSFCRNVHLEDLSLLDYARRAEQVFQLWRENGSWNLAHPWMEAALPWDRSAEYIHGVLKSFPPHLLGGGQVVLAPCKAITEEVPMFVQPEGEYYMTFGIQPSVPKHLVSMAVSLLNRASDLAVQIGGKRYLSGWIEFDSAQWQAHYGPVWSKVLQWKEFFDPNHILNPGFIKYDDDTHTEPI